MVDIPEPVIVVCGVALVLACACGLWLIITGADIHARPRTPRPRLAVVERERDIAAALGWPWRGWVAFRAAALIAAAVLSWLSGVWTAGVILLLVAVFGVRFAVAGRAAKRRLTMERAFMGQLRVLRDRMAVANQPLDSALVEMALSPPAELRQVLAPLRRGGSIADNIVASAERSRSAVVEQAAAVLLWARTRSVDALIDVIDDVLLPVVDAELAVEEESLVTLAQQRAVTFAMAALMAFLFLSMVRVDSFRAYYATVAGGVVLLLAVCSFFALMALLSRIVRVSDRTRWNLRTMAEQEARPHA